MTRCRKGNLFTTDANVNWCSFCGKEYSCFLKKKKKYSCFSKILLRIHLKEIKLSSRRDIPTFIFIALFTTAKTWKQSKCFWINWARSITNLLIIPCGYLWQGFPGSSVVKNTPAEDSGSIPGSGRSPGEGNGNPLQ